MTHLIKPEMRGPDVDLGVSSERRAMWDEHRRNFDYFFEHSVALFAEHPGQWLLVHSGDKVEAFEDLEELFLRRDKLPYVQRKAAMIKRRKVGAWIL